MPPIVFLMQIAVVPLSMTLANDWYALSNMLVVQSFPFENLSHGFLDSRFSGLG